ncbi:MAG: sensor domain-containing diguanylate cyclase [Ruminococcaceae bacterium]|nr:sensor domain-containing diguanylate cyclase [Oscillospiraceae bacterium]
MKRALKLKLVPIYILTAVLFSLVCACTAAALILSGADTGVLLWFVPLMLVLCTAWAIISTIIVRKIRERFSESFDHVLSAFAKEDVEALKSINGGDPLPEQLSRWILEQSELSDKARRNTAAISAEVETSSEIFWRITGKSCTCRYGEYWERNYGYINLNGSSDIRNHIRPADLPELERAVKNVLDGVSSSFETVAGLMLTPQKTVTVRIRGKGVADSSDSGKRVVVGTAHDIDIEADLESKLETEQIKSRFLAESAKDVIYEVDVPENKLVSLNPEISGDLFGMGSMGDFDGERRPYWENIHPDYREGFIDRFFDYNHMMIMPERMMTYEYRIRNKSGDYIWVEHKAQVTAYRNNRVEKVIGRIVNINETKGKELDLHFKSECDSLTGALLKSALGKQYAEGLSRGSTQALVLININRFRLINSQFGHEFGDVVLRRFVAILWENQKGKCIVGRADDDKFIVGMLLVDEKDHPESQIAKLLPVFSEPLKINNKTVNITFSASGSIPSSETSFEEAYEQAEKALEVCKSVNRLYNNSFMMYDSETEKQFEQLSHDESAQDDQQDSQ